MIVAFVVAPYVMNPSRSSASSFQWVQSGWGTTPPATSGACATAGGTWVNNVCVASQSSNKTNWTTYASKSPTGIAAAAGGVTLTTSAPVVTGDQSGYAGANTGDGLTAGTYNSATMYKPTAGSTLKLKKQLNINCGADTVNGNGECVSDYCNGGICADACAGVPTVSYGGQTYTTVGIGTQCWFKQNLNIGTMITSPTTQSNNAVIEKWCFGNTTGGCDNYGGLYSWNEAMQYTGYESSQGICPTGWHIPTKAQWTTLTNYLSANSKFWCGGTSTNIAKALAGTSLWTTSTGACLVGDNLTLNNTSGFSAVGSGMYDDVNKYFNSAGWGSSMWSSTYYVSGVAWWYLGLSYNSATPYINQQTGYGFSVRCIKN